MENVVKQGFLKLKKGNPNDGRVLSGILEKMTPRKWYVLIVRNRVPFLEQYDRDVDVFSGAPCVAYNLSACSSICRTMSTTARTFSFYIVCPDDLVELIAASREQMVDWCNTLEHTLGSLGILKREKEEHIYTVCPAVVNFVGRSQLKTSEDEDDPSRDYEDELGAVGGTPAPPTNPPPRSQAPPIPTSHHPPLPRMLSEPASYRSSPSPPSLRSVRNFPRGRSSSPSEVTSAAASSAPPSPHISTPLPLPPACQASDTPPPLPRGRPPNSPSRAAVRPPPLPPARPPPPPVPAVVSTKQEKGLPPVPLPMSVTASSGSRKQPAGACDSEEEESESDYSSDFVSGAFWEINRKTPIPSARHAVWPPKSSVPNPSSSSSSAAPSVASLGAGAGDESFEDEGYTDLSTVSIGRRPEPPEQPDDDDKNDKKYEYAKVKKKPTAAVGAIRRTDNSEGTESSVNENPSSSPCVESSNTGETSVETSATDAVCSPAQSENDLVTDGGTENFYAPFPVESDDSSMESSRHNEDCDYDDMGVGVSVVKILSSPAHRSRSPAELPQTPEEDVVEDCMYASACEASSLFPSDSGPPLPPRQDSLSAWKLDGESTNHTGAENASQTSTPTESPIRRPIPRRRTLHSSSHPVTRAELEGSALQASLVVTDIPPIPPPRRGIPVSMCQSMMEGLLSPPPPLPTRRTQSVHGQRPVSLMAPPTSSSSLAAEPDNNGFPTDMSQSFSGATTLTRQQSFGNGDTSAAENHLRQRMRLDRGHSIHSVISLKQSQADILRQEMDLPGVTVTVTLRAAMGIALVDCAEAVCIAGWNQKDFPSLHGKFHIGDQLISIGNVKVMSAAMAIKMLKHPPVDLVGMLVKRTPHAKVMAIRRVAEGQSIGIKRNGGTAEILYVDPNGLAASNGLPLHAPGILSGQTRTSWVLTEINSRHLNLFFKEVEIEHRLNAVGREITIVVQPSDYITELKKQLKKIKNYKNYIVQ